MGAVLRRGLTPEMPDRKCPAHTVSTTGRGRCVQTRLRVDPRTQEYCERRSRESNTQREIVRSLKRYASREVYHLVRPVQPQPSS